MPNVFHIIQRIGGCIIFHPRGRPPYMVRLAGIQLNIIIPPPPKEKRKKKLIRPKRGHRTVARIYDIVYIVNLSITIYYPMIKTQKKKKLQHEPPAMVNQPHAPRAYSGGGGITPSHFGARGVHIPLFMLSFASAVVAEVSERQVISFGIRRETGEGN